MKFRTEINILEFKDNLTLNPRKSITAAGSCFASNIISRMKDSLWDAAAPLGTLYNPFSISQALKNIIKFDDEKFENSLIHHENRWHSFWGDSSFSAITREEVAHNVRKRYGQCYERLKISEALIITFGTAWCYFHTEDSQSPVANCHKIPASAFSRRCLKTKEIIAEWKSLIPIIKKEFPELEIIFTVSPIRHLKDGLHENSLSKAVLQLSLADICEEFTFCHYFPAYEILMDDLRDYRFYEDDLIHPSDFAKDYIWEKFCECYLDRESRELLKEGLSLTKALRHRSILETESDRIIRQEKILSKIEKFLSYDSESD